MIAPAVTVSAANGPVDVEAIMLAYGVSMAIGWAAEFKEKSDADIAAAVGLNVEQINNEALVGKGAVVESKGQEAAITVAATAPGELSNLFIVWGLAGAGGKSKADVAGSIGVQVIEYRTTASVGAGATLDSAGALTVEASNPMALQDLVLAGGLSIGGSAVGGAIAVNVIEPDATKAYIESGTAPGSVTTVNAAGALTVSAASSLMPFAPDLVDLKIEGERLPKGLEGDVPVLSSIAIGAAASSGEAAVSGSVIVDVYSFTTEALIGEGAQVNQSDHGGAGQTITVKASDPVDLVNVAGGLALTKGNAGVGVGLIVEVIEVGVHAGIGADAAVQAGGDIAVEASSSENYFELAVELAASSKAGVAGSIVVLALNQSGTGCAPGGPGTCAEIGYGSTVTSGGNVTVKATDTAESIGLYAGQVSVGGKAGVGVSSTTLLRTEDVNAGIAEEASVSSAGAGGLTVAASDNENIKLIAIGGSVGGNAGVAGSATVDVLNDTTKASIGEGATVNCQGADCSDPGAASSQGVAVTATDTTTTFDLAGVLAIGGDAGVGAGVDVQVLTKNTIASIGANTAVRANGNIIDTATSSEEVLAISAGASFAGDVAVTVNAGVSVLDITTEASIGSEARAQAGDSVNVAANEGLSLDVIAGNISGAGDVAVGAAGAVPVVTKTTTATIGKGADVNALGNGSGATVDSGSFTVETVDPRFDPKEAIEEESTINLAADDPGYVDGFTENEAVRYDNGGGEDIEGLPCGEDIETGEEEKCEGNTGGNASEEPKTKPEHVGQVYYVKIVSNHQIQLRLKPEGEVLTGLKAPVHGGESQRFIGANTVTAPSDDSPRFTPSKDVHGNIITLPYKPDFGNEELVIYSAGGGTPIGGLKDGEEYVAREVKGGKEPGYEWELLEHGEPHKLVELEGSAATGRSHSIVKKGDEPSANASGENKASVSASTTEGFHGVSVTASNTDNVAAVGISAAIAGDVAVSLSGAVDVINAETLATIGEGASIDCNFNESFTTAECAADTTGSSGAQAVNVAAADSYRALGIAVSLAIGGDVGVAPSAAVGVSSLTTKAFIGKSAKVNAERLIELTSEGQQAIISIVAGAAGGEVGVAASAGVTVLKANTWAYTGEKAKLVSAGNVLVDAADTTGVISVAGDVAGGFVGVSAGVGVLFIEKETQAFVGNASTVEGLAKSGETLPRSDHEKTAVRDGASEESCSSDESCFPTFETFDGVAVQASSGENIFGLAVAVGAGVVGVAGAVNITLAKVTTEAYVGEHTTVNSGGSVDVAAVDYAKTLTIGGGVAGGFVGVGGGIDVGVLSETIEAFTGTGSDVTAADEADVYALTYKEITTFAIGLAGGFVGVSGGVSVWIIGTQPTTTYSETGGVLPEWKKEVKYAKGEVVTYCSGMGCEPKTFKAKVKEPNMTESPEEATSEWEVVESKNALAGGSGGPVATADQTASGQNGSTSFPAWAGGKKYEIGTVVESEGKDYEALVNDPSESKKPGENSEQWKFHSSVQAWSEASEYGKGAVVEYGGKSYVAKETVAAKSKDPGANPAWELQSASSEQASGSPGYNSVLTGTSNSSKPAPWSETTNYKGGEFVEYEGNYYESYPPQWSKGTKYGEKATVEYKGKFYEAKVADPNEAKTPESNSAQWTLLGSSGNLDLAPATHPSRWTNVTGQFKTNSRIAEHTGSSGECNKSTASGQIACGSEGNGEIVASGLSPKEPPKPQCGVVGTSAEVCGKITAGGNVNIVAHAQLKLLGVAGAVAGGFVGAGISVLVVAIEGATDAGVGAGGSVSAGALSGRVTVNATLQENVFGIAFAGAGGVVGTAGAVAVLVDSSSQNAHVASDNHVAYGSEEEEGPTDTASIPQAGGGVYVEGVADRSVRALTPEVTIGGIAAGASVATVLMSGNDTAKIGDVAVGSSHTVGSIKVNAEDSLHPYTEAISIAAGAGAGIAGAVAWTELSGTTLASSGAHGSVGSGGMTVEATGNHGEIQAKTLNVAVSGVFALGLTIRHAADNRSTEAKTTASSTPDVALSTTGAVSVSAHATNHASAVDLLPVLGTVSLGAGALSIVWGVAEVGGATRVELDGNVSSSSSITAIAHGDNHAESPVRQLALSIVGGGGVFSGAEITSGAAIEALVGSGATLASSGAIEVDAQTENAAGEEVANTAIGHVESLNVGLGLAVTILVSQAKVDSPVRATLDGTVTSSKQITVKAISTDNASSITKLYAISLGAAFGGSGASAEVGEDANTEATAAATSSLNSTEAIDFEAHSANGALAESNGGAGALGLAISIDIPEATVAGDTVAGVGGAVTDASGVTITAKSDNDAEANSTVITVGLVAGTGPKSSATITSTAVTDACAGVRSGTTCTGGKAWTVPGGAIALNATATNHAQSTASGYAFGGGAVNILGSNASDGGAVLADFDQKLSKISLAKSVSVHALGQNLATSVGESITVAGLAISGELSTAQITSAASTEAAAGAEAVIDVTGAVSVDAELVPTTFEDSCSKEETSTLTAGAIADSCTRGGSGSLASLTFMASEALDGGAVKATLDGEVAGSKEITVKALSQNQARSDTFTVSISLAAALTGSGSGATISSSASTEATAGGSSSLDASEAIRFEAESSNYARAQSDGGAGSIYLTVAINLPEASVAGATAAGIGGKVEEASGVTIAATSHNDAEARSKTVSVGLAAGTGPEATAKIAAANTDACAGVISGSSCSGGKSWTVPGGEIALTATSHNSAQATAAGQAYGAVGIQVLEPNASDSGATLANFDQELSKASPSKSLTVHASGENAAAAEAEGITVGIGIALAGILATAEVTSGASTEAGAGPDAAIYLTGALSIRAEQAPASAECQGNTITGGSVAAACVHGVGGGIASVTWLGSHATVDGAVHASLDGDVPRSSSIAVEAKGNNTANASTTTVDVGVVTISGSGASSEIGSGASTEATAGSSAKDVSSEGEISFMASSENRATTTSDAGTGGLIVVSISKPSATIDAATEANFDGTVEKAAAVTIDATANNLAEAVSSLKQGGLFSGAGSESEADLGSLTKTAAIVGPAGKLGEPGASEPPISGTVTVHAKATNNATSVSSSISGALVEITISHPTATDESTTEAAIEGSVGEESPGAGAVDVRATGEDEAVARVSTAGGGLVSGSGSAATATSEPTVKARFGAHQITATGEVALVASSSTGTATYSEATHGGLLNIESLSTNTYDKPTVAATVEGAAVTSEDGAITISATHGAPLKEYSNGTIEAVEGGDTLRFKGQIGVKTGSAVVYEPTGETNKTTGVNESVIGGLLAGATYGVIYGCGTESSCETLELGEQFSFEGATLHEKSGTAVCEAPKGTYDPSGTVAACIDEAEGTIVFAAPDNLHTGDLVDYGCETLKAQPTCSTASARIAGTVENLSPGLYEVLVVNPTTIRLRDPHSSTTTLSFVPSTTIKGSVFEVSTPALEAAGITTGSAVTYHAPETQTFSGEAVGVIIVSTTFDGRTTETPKLREVKKGEFEIEHVSDNQIYIPNHGYETGELVKYSCAQGLGESKACSAIGGLSLGETYEVVKVNNNSIELRKEKANAKAKATEPLAISNGGSGEQILTPLDNSAISGLVNGDTYYVELVKGGFKLLSSSLTPVTVSGSGHEGVHHLSVEGLGLLDAGTGRQKLVIQLGAARELGTMLGIGGPGALIGTGSGNDVPTSASTGVGGGLISVKIATSDTFSEPKVTTSILKGSKLYGGSVIVSAASEASGASDAANTAAASSRSKKRNQASRSPTT